MRACYRTVSYFAQREQHEAPARSTPGPKTPSSFISDLPPKTPEASLFLDKIVPEIPEAFRERFRERQTEAGLDSLRMGALLLTLCFAVEAYFQSVGRTIFFVAPLVLAFSHACLAFAMIRYQFRPRRVALWQFASIMSVYGLTLLSLLQYEAPQIVGY